MHIFAGNYGSRAQGFLWSYGPDTSAQYRSRAPRSSLLNFLLFIQAEGAVQGGEAPNLLRLESDDLQKRDDRTI